MNPSSLAALLLACGVCYGDPEDPMIKGAMAGVAVLGGVIAFVLAWITVVGVFFVRRGRRVAREREAATLGTLDLGRTAGAPAVSHRPGPLS